MAKHFDEERALPAPGRRAPRAVTTALGALLAAAMGLTLAGCGGATQPDPAKPDGTGAPTAEPPSKATAEPKPAPEPTAPTPATADPQPKPTPPQPTSPPPT